MPLSRYQKLNRPSLNLAIGSSGGLGCLPRITFLQMLQHGSNLIEASAADGSSAGNARHLLHLFGQATKQAVLRFLTEFIFKNVDAKVHTLFTNMHLWSAISLRTSFCVL
jgi:hypothetical protein